MDYETARRVRGRSVKELTIQNIANGGSIVGSYKTAIGSKFKARATKLQEKFDPLNWVNMLNSPLTTAIVGRLFGRKSSTIRYYLDKQKRNKNPNYTKVGPGRATKLRIGDSSADILAKMFNLMQKEHDESLKRWELESEHSQQRKDDEEKRHQELLKAIAGMGHTTVKVDNDDEKKKSKSLKEKLEALFKDIMKPIEAIGEFFKDVFKFVEKIFLNIGKTLFEIGKGLVDVLKFVGEIGLDFAEMVGKAVLKVVGLIGPIFNKTFAAIGLAIEEIFKWLSKHEAKLGAMKALQALTGTGEGGSQSEAEEKNKIARRRLLLKAGMAILQNTTMPTPEEEKQKYDLLEILKKEQENPYTNASTVDKLLGVLGAAMQGGVVGEVAGAGVGAVESRIKAPKAGPAAPEVALANIIIEGAKGAGMAGFALGAAEYKKAFAETNQSAESKEKLLYYGPEATMEMDNTGKGPTDPEISKMIMNYQKEHLVPDMVRQGLRLANPKTNELRYDMTQMKPYFYDEEGNQVDSKELLSRTLEEILQKKANTQFDKLKELTGFDVNKLKNWSVQLEQNAITSVNKETHIAKNNMRSGYNDLLSNAQIMLKKVENLATDTDMNNGATIIMPTVTNTTEGPGLKRKEGDGIGLVRSTDTSLRQCQLNYAIAC